MYLEPNSNLILTGGHSFLVDELTENQIHKMKKYWPLPKKIQDKYLLLSCFHEKCVKLTQEGIFDLYHLVLEDSDENQQFGIWTNGILTESMSKNVYNSK